MIIKNGELRDMIIIAGHLHMPNYGAVLKNVFNNEYENLEGDEFINVGIKLSDSNQYLYRKDKEKWSPETFTQLMDDLSMKVADDEKEGRNEYKLNEDIKISDETKEKIETKLVEAAK